MIAALLAVLLVPEVVMPRPLEVSAVSADPVELERLATRLGPTRLLRLVVGAQASGQLRAAAAALRGLGLSGSLHPAVAAQGLLPLAELVGRTEDEKLLGAATEALVRLCEGLRDFAWCAEPTTAAAAKTCGWCPSICCSWRRCHRCRCRCGGS